MVDMATKLRRTFIAIPKIVYILILIILCITFSDLKGRPRTFNSPETNTLQAVFTNALKMPITDVQVVANTADCAAGYEAASLGDWKGTVQGCNCQGVITVGSCTSSACTNIPAIPGITISKWRSQKICVQRLAGYSNPVNKACEGKTACTSAGICVDAGATCPITGLIYAQTTDPVSGAVTGFSLTRVDDEALPFIDVSVSLFDLPCMDPTTMPYSKTRVPYPLSSVPENGCGGSGLVDHLQNVNSNDLRTVMSDNGFSSWSALPGFDTYVEGEKAYLIGNRLYQFFSDNDNCKTVDPSLFESAKAHENKFVSRVYPLLIAGIVVISIKFFTIILEMVLRIRKNEEEDHWVNLVAILNLLGLLALCALCIIIGSFAIRAEVALSPLTSYFKFLAYNNCFTQSVVNKTFQVFQGNISNFWAIVWLCITLLIVSAVGIIVTTIMGFVNHFYGKNIGFKSYYKNVGKKFKKKNTPANTNSKMQGSNIEMLLNR